jgi:hypothetical protein
MNEVLEKAAKAVWDSWPAGSQTAMPWPNCPEHNRCVATARAVIAAMREPTKAMRNAAAAAMSPGKRPTEKRVSDKAKHAIRYRAMIDEALK